jgi:hypothetical protein
MDFNASINKYKQKLIAKLEDIHDHINVNAVEEAMLVSITIIQIYGLIIYTTNPQQFQPDEFATYGISYLSKVFRLDFITTNATVSLYSAIIHYIFCTLSILQAILLFIKFQNKFMTLLVHICYLCSTILTIPLCSKIAHQPCHPLPFIKKGFH